jgi:hypothetical protein
MAGRRCMLVRDLANEIEPSLIPALKFTERFKLQASRPESTRQRARFRATYRQQ